MYKEEVIEKVKSLVNFFNEKFNINEPFPTVKFYSGNKTAGLYNLARDEVSFNEFILRTSTIENTIIHEIAHKFCFVIYPHAKQFHGPEWRRLFKMAGGNGKTKLNIAELPESIRLELLTTKRKTRKFEYKCRCSSSHYVSTVRHNRMVKGYKYRCGKCYDSIEFVKEV